MKVIEVLTIIKNYIIKNIEHLIIITLVLVSIFFKIIWPQESPKLQSEANPIVPELTQDIPEETPAEKNSITVDIKGLVNKPGVYVFENDANVNDLIKVAGGLKSGGTTSNINLSKKLTDQMVVIIYSTKELETKDVSDVVNCSTYNINDCKKTEEKTSIIENNHSTANSNNNSSKISINTATIAELMTLSGIGESKAVAIIEYRNANGNFTKIEDLMNVSGIGESTFAKIKENITI